MAEEKKALQALADYGHIGISFVLCIVIGAWGGSYLDETFFEGRTSPWFTYLGLAFGIGAAFKSLYDVMVRLSKE